MLETGRKTLHNTGFVSGGLKCLDNIDERALCLYSSVVLVDPACAGCSVLTNSGKRKTFGHQKNDTTKMRNIGLIIGILITTFSFGQTEKIDVYDLPIPNNLESCFDILDKTLSNIELDVVKNYPEDSIYYHNEFIHRTDFFHAWKIYGGSRLTEYFNKMGLVGSFEIYETILVSYHRYLNNMPIDLEGQIAKYQAIQKADYEEYHKRTVQDSINDIYIPKDLKDCFVTLDSLLSHSDIDSIKALPNREETIIYHHGLGTWIRNNWGLWGGSRLQQYLIAKGLGHPDYMSATILEFYYDWLNGQHEKWKEFEAK